MDFDLFKCIVDQARGFITSYVVQLRGEPLIHPRFTDMVHYIRQTVPSSSIWFNTNGLLLTPAITDRLLRTGVNGIYFSIDAATEDVYRGIRIGSNFRQVLGNIDYLLQARPLHKMAIQPEVGVSFVIQSQNRHEKKAFLRSWLRQVDFVRFYSKVEMDRRRPAKFFQPRGSKKACESLWNSITVLSDGTVVPCCGDLNPMEPLGNICKDPLEAVVARGRYIEMRGLHLAGKMDTIPLCKDCDTWMAYETRQRTFFNPPITVNRNPLSECWAMVKRS